MIEFPEPLFESSVEGKRLCLVCARKQATKTLRTISQPIVPVCDDCSAEWNFYGYLILKRIKPANLVKRIVAYKLLHPFQEPSVARIWHDVGLFKEWAKKMRRFMTSRPS